VLRFAIEVLIKKQEVTEHKTKQQLCKDTDEDCRSQKAEESEKG
jgi:hypothetical protein